MPQKFRWRLVYPTNDPIDEREDGASIKDRRPGAVELQVMRMSPNGLIPICRVPLIANGVHYEPIWYRKRSMDLFFAPMAIPQETKTDLVVFGRGVMVIAGQRGREVDTTFEGIIYALTPRGDIIECPKWAIDQGAISNVIMWTETERIARR